MWNSSKNTRRSRIKVQYHLSKSYTGGKPKPAKCECEISPYVLGDSACLSSPWLMKPYPKGTRHPREIVFNKDLSFGGVKVECGFVVLKDRCRILSRSSSR